MAEAVIAATGLFTPEQSISNEELVASFNAWVDKWNAENAAAIEAGAVEAKQHSSVEFVEKASGVKSRHVVDKEGVLDIERMKPKLAPRSNEETSVLAEIALAACDDALKNAGRTAADVDAVICAASNMQRAYPAMAIEVQDRLGIDGWGFDMNVACSSATFGVQTAADMIAAGHADAILVVSPEICSGHLNFRDRDSHFIFGDVATAILLERGDTARNGRGAWDILGMKLKTKFSNNIRNNAGFLNRAEDGVNGAVSHIDDPETDKLFVQEGRRVFKDVVPMVSDMILAHMQELGVAQADLKRLWLHQANVHMNDFIARKVLGRDATKEENPIILDEYANTSSAGSIIAFHKHNADFQPGDIGVICSFGAGYSAGSVFVRRAA